MPTRLSSEAIPPEEIEHGRLLAAIAYLPALCFVGLVGMPDNRFVGFHARQGFLLLLVEIVCYIFFAIFDTTLGRIPFVGPIVGYLVKFLVWVAVLGVTVYALLKAVGREMVRLPYLGDHIENVPF